MHPAEAERRWRNAVQHLEFCAEIYKLQIREGRYFIHEHPLSATSWKLPCIEEIIGTDSVIKTSIHMCAYGMHSEDENGGGLVYKPTG